MISVKKPTPGPIRGSDSYGSGWFGAPRGSRKHKGVDYVVNAGDPVYSPVDGVVRRIGLPYAGDIYRLVEIDVSGAPVVARVFYVSPGLPVGSIVRTGQVIGVAQDLRIRYPKDASHGRAITNHVHFELGLLGGACLVSPGKAPASVVWVNPLLFMS